MGTMIKKKKKWNDRRLSPSDPREGKKFLPSGPVEVATCGSRSNRVDRRDPNEGLIGSPRGSSTRLWRRPIVPPSACPVPTEYPKFQLDYTSAPVLNSLSKGSFLARDSSVNDSTSIPFAKFEEEERRDNSKSRTKRYLWRWYQWSQHVTRTRRWRKSVCEMRQDVVFFSFFFFRLELDVMKIDESDRNSLGSTRD